VKAVLDSALMKSSKLVALALSFTLAGCIGIDTAKANKKVEESNTAMEAANKAIKEGNEATQDAATKAVTDPDAAAEPAKKCVAKLDEASGKVDEASKLLKEAADMKVTKEFSDYLSLMSKAHAKVSETIDVQKTFCKSLTTKAEPDKISDAVKKMQTDIDAKQKEAQDLQDQADKIRKDNPSKFQQ